MGEIEGTTRDLVLRALALRPGSGITDLVRMTGRGNGTIEHAVHTLQKEGLVKDHGDGMQPSFFRADQGQSGGFRVRGAAVPLLAIVHEKGTVTAAELAKQAGVSASEVSRVLGRLEKDGFVASVRRSGRVHYVALDPPQPGQRRQD